ncbi:MAG TPA: hypothetical protein QGI39_04685 [Gammaproteobacteria bacterium]|nr:hypothetical protein [Gammaproteobacteria bacterium]
MSKLLQEIKRRNIVKVGAAYAIVAWVLIQVSESLLPALQLPDWTLSLIVVLLLLGFPITLIMAWAFELTPDGVRPAADSETAPTVSHAPAQRITNAMLALVLLAVGFLVVDQYVLDSGNPGPGSDQQAGLTAAVVDSANVGSSLPIRTTIELHPDAPLVVGGPPPLIGFHSTSIALSPDGRYLAYVGEIAGGAKQLFMRDLAQYGFEPVAGTEGAVFPFFSPNSQWLGFLTNTQVKKVTVIGGTPVTLANAEIPISAFWQSDDSIFVATREGGYLTQTSASGGALVPVEFSDEPSTTVISEVLPQSSLHLSIQTNESNSMDYASITLVDTVESEQRILLDSGYGARYVPSGHLLFGRGGALYTAAFDVDSLGITGEAQRVVSNVAMESIFGQIQVTFSANGLLAYAEGGDSTIASLQWIDRSGDVEEVPLAHGFYNTFDLSSNDQQLAIHVVDVQDFVQIYQFQTDTARRLPISGAAGWPFWSPDDSNLIVTQQSREGFLPGSIDLNRSQTLKPVTIMRPYWFTASFWSIDDSIFFNAPSVGLGYQAVDSSQFNLFVDEPQAWGAQASQDGRWVAYASLRTGRHEIWVRSCPDGEIDRQLSTDGGIEPVWCRECDEIFFRNGNQWFASKVSLEPELSIAPPQPVWDVPGFVDTGGRSYDVSRDGQRLLVLRSVNPPVRTSLKLVQN